MTCTSDSLLHERLEIAMQQVAWQAGMHTLFTEALPSDGNYAQDWLKQVEAWEENPDVRNPYFHEGQVYMFCLIYVL